MNLKDMKDRVADAISTENPKGTDYNGTELDEADVQAAREHMEEVKRAHEKKEVESAGTPT